MLQLIPPVLRRATVYILFRCCLHPLKELYDRYSNYIDLIDQKLAQLSYTATLSAWLNAVFYLPDGTIYIEDTIDKDVYLFFNKEVPDIRYLFTEEESEPIYLRLKPDEDEFEGFIIHLPKQLATDDNIRIIQKWVDYYKIAGVNYKIEADE